MSRLFLRPLVLSFGLVFSLAALAAGSNRRPAEMAPVVDDAPFFPIATLVSEPGESRDQFVLRVGQVLASWTAESKFEGCSRIYVNYSNTAYRVDLATNRAHMACLYPKVPPSGWASIGQTIHSHTDLDIVRANAADVLLSGNVLVLGERLKFLHHDQFSSYDVLNGPGFLVTANGVRYFDGRDAVSNVVAFRD